jgi:hypothetical protein
MLPKSPNTQNAPLKQAELLDPRDRRENVLAHLEAWIAFGEDVLDLSSTKSKFDEALLDARHYFLDRAINSARGCADHVRRFSDEYPGAFDQLIKLEILPLASSAALVMGVLAGARLTTSRRQFGYCEAFMRAMRASPDRGLIPPKRHDRPTVIAFLARLAPGVMPQCGRG